MSAQLANLVIDDTSMSLHSFMRILCHGSNRVDFVGEFLFILSTAYSQTCVKAVMLGGSEGGGALFLVPEGTNVSIIVLILFNKEEATGESMTCQTGEMEVLFQKPYIGFCTARAIIFVTTV